MNRLLPILLLGVVVAVAIGGITFSVFFAGDRPDGPVDVVWDKAACAACGMHVGEPPFAAQLVTTDGHVYIFDDPGCLFQFAAHENPSVHGVWFHHRSEPRWLPSDQVSFVAATPTPMGFGLAAVDRGEPGALDLESARAKCLAGDERRGR